MAATNELASDNWPLTRRGPGPTPPSGCPSPAGPSLPGLFASSGCSWTSSIFAGDREAYTYLPESVQGFVSAGELASVMEEAGLHNVAVRKLALGSVAIIGGMK